MQKRDEILRYLIINKTAKTTDLMNKLGINEKTFYNSTKYLETCKMITFDRDNHIISIVGYKPLDKRIEVSIKRLLNNPTYFFETLKMPQFRKYNTFDKFKNSQEKKLWKIIEFYNREEPVDFNRKEKLLDLVANDIEESKNSIREEFDKTFASVVVYQERE